MNEKELIKQMTEEFIIPNWYTPENFGITNWSEERTQQFKDWFASKVCSHDPFREIMQEYIENFEQDIPYEDDEDEADSDEDDDETLDGDMEFDDKGYRIYWDAVEEDWVASEKFATKRFLDLLKSRPNFEGFDNGADEYDSDEEDDYLCSPSEPEPDMIDDTIVSGIVCNKCNNIVPDHYYVQHIAPDNPIHDCPHVIHPICAMNMHLILLDNIKNNTLHKYKNYVEPLKNFSSPPEPESPPCTDENRCEECTHCARTKPCSCGCGLLGGSCTIGYKMDNK